MATPDRRTLSAVLAFVAALVALAAPAAAVEREGLEVERGRPAHTEHGPLSCCSNPYSAFSDNTASYAMPPTCAPGSQMACDTIPLRVTRVPAGEALLKAVVRWTDYAVGLRISLWRQTGTHFEIVEGKVATSAHGPGSANVDGSEAGQLAAFDPAPRPGAYAVVVENSFGATGAAPAGYVLDISVEVDPGWPIDAAPVDSSGSPSVAESVTAAAPGSVSEDEVDAAGADPAAPSVAGRLGSLRAVEDGSAPAAAVSDTLPWLLLAVAVVALLVVSMRLRRQITQRELPLQSGLASWFANLRLFWKLLVPFVVVLLVIGTAGAYLTVRYLASRADTTLNQTLLERSVGAQTHLRDQELYLLEAERLAANLEGVPEATAARDAARLTRDLASAVAVRKDLDLVAATDSAGLGLAEYVREGGGFATHAGTAWSEARAVRDVLADKADVTGDKHTSFVGLPDGTVFLLTAGPIRTDRVVGAAVAGLSVDRLASGAGRRARGTVALYDSTGARMGSSGGSAMPLRLSDRLRGSTIRERNDETATVYEPFEVRGERVGTVATRIPVGGVYASVRGAALRLGLLIALAMAAVVGFGIVVSRYILRAVEPLVETNRALGQGDLSVRAPVRSGDELGELAQGFNVMAEQLQASYAELERRVAERTEELSRLYEQNLESGQARDQFFATVSHEFRTPLFAILANAELLTDPTLRPDSPEEASEFAETIEASARTLLERVNELLDLAKSKSTGVELDTVPVSVSSVWREIEPQVRALARTGDLKVVTEVAPDVAVVLADPSRLRQIMLNITSNAIKYTPAGGRVTVSAASEGDEVRVAVADTGVGIPESVGDDVFEPYYRVEGSRAQGNWASTGLGLALTRRLVEAHGGRIWFESSPLGTTFFFTLPVVRSPAVSD